MRLDNILSVWADIDASYNEWNAKKEIEPVVYLKKLICYRNRACQLGEIRNMLGPEIKEYNDEQVSEYNDLIESFKQMEEFFNTVPDEELKDLKPSEIMVCIARFLNPCAEQSENTVIEISLDDFSWQKEVTKPLGAALKSGIVNNTVQDEYGKIVTHVVRNNTDAYYKTNDAVSFGLLFRRLQTKADTHFDQVCMAILNKIVRASDRSVADKTLIFVRPECYSMANGRITIDQFSLAATSEDKRSLECGESVFDYYKYILQDNEERPVDLYFVQ